MLARTFSGTVWGVEVDLVQIEVHVDNGLPAFHIVGLPGSAVRESRERVRSALVHSGFSFPARRIVVNLAPASVRKTGAGLDLGIAMAVLAASGQIPREALEKTAFLAELGLDGTLRPVGGVLPVTLELAARGKTTCFVAAQNCVEAALTRSIQAIPAARLVDVTDHVRGKKPLAPMVRDPGEQASTNGLLGDRDMAYVQGHAIAKRALTVAAAGGHSVMLVGPPGSGKTLLASIFSSLLPDLCEAHALEVTRLHSIAGTLPPDGAILTRPPLRCPHTTITQKAMAGGGAPPVPGEVTLAHRGVLLMDEMPEFRRPVLEALRCPISHGFVQIDRLKSRSRFPSQFILVGTANPCPCGYYGTQRTACECSTPTVRSYQSRISGPLLDRIDMHLTVERQTLSTEVRDNRCSSADIRERVFDARHVHQSRNVPQATVGEMARVNLPALEQHCRLEGADKRWLYERMDQIGYSHRAYHRVLGMARTIADLAGCDRLQRRHLSEALLYRHMDYREGEARG